MEKRYLTIRQAAAQQGFPNEATIRALVKQGRCPGFYQRSRFYVDAQFFREELDERCRREGGAGA